jgi:hypothetical protein
MALLRRNRGVGYKVLHSSDADQRAKSILQRLGAVGAVVISIPAKWYLAFGKVGKVELEERVRSPLALI